VASDPPALKLRRAGEWRAKIKESSLKVRGWVERFGFNTEITEGGSTEGTRKRMKPKGGREDERPREAGDKGAEIMPDVSIKVKTC
jgi:hypothetical protein